MEDLADDVASVIEQVSGIIRAAASGRAIDREVNSTLEMQHEAVKRLDVGRY